MIDLESLLSCLSLDRPHQMRAVRVALHALLVREQKGMVLADEVGCGKTYEALAIAALLWRHFADSNDEKVRIRRILVVAEPALMHKWFDEIEAAENSGRGFQQYVRHDQWQRFRAMLRNVEQLRRWSDGAERGRREDGKLQVPPDKIYIAKPSLIAGERAGDASPLVRWLRQSDWDIVIVDEAHHFGGLHTEKCRIFFPDQTIASRTRGLSARYTLALTATPFQLATRELLNLLRVVWAPQDYLTMLGDGLRRYEEALRAFYARRNFAPEHDARKRWVDRLFELRTVDASGGHVPATPGLEELLRRYIVRNVKGVGERDYALIERLDGQFVDRRFGKLDDLDAIVGPSPLIPFEGDHAWTYLHLRDLVADADRAARETEAMRPSFVAGDLRQCLSSYEQLLESALLQKPLPRAQAVRATVEALQSKGRTHPKLDAFAQVVGRLVDDDLERIRAGVASGRAQWFSKILVFNSLMKTARALNEALSRTFATRLDSFVDEQLSFAGFARREDAEEAVRTALRKEREEARERLYAKFKKEHLMVTRDLVQRTGVEMSPDSRELVDVMFLRAEKHCTQSLFLLRMAIAMRLAEDRDDFVTRFVMMRVGHRLGAAIDRIVDDYLDDTPRQGEPFSFENKDRARREIGRLARILSAPRYVARFDGDQSDEDREMRRENFNRPYAPLLLLVSRVGEEGIDLQAHTRHVLHYDVEWNPAKMEQREGRVDREGRRTHGAVQVRFALLKDTYEERVFHTVMQRDAWFQILIGSKRQELAKQVSGIEDPEADIDLGPFENGRLSAEERERVMIDLQPREHEIGVGARCS